MVFLQKDLEPAQKQNQAINLLLNEEKNKIPWQDH
jgi:hypothetical protein